MHGDVAVDLVLPAVATSASEARRLLRDALDGVGSAESVDAAQVAISEIVTNALVHAGTPMRLRVLLADEHLRVELSDGSPHLPHRRDYSAQAATGRGLHMVSEMVDRWGSYAIGDGKVVWFEIASDREGDELDTFTRVPSADDPTVVAMVEVELLNMPLLMHAAWQEHAAALLRELLLVRLEDDFGVLESHAAASGALSLLFEQVPAPLLGDEPGAIMATATEPAVSASRLLLAVPEPAMGQFDVLDEMLQEAVALAEQGELLSPPTQPEIQAMRAWLCRQVRDQAVGATPLPWASPQDSTSADSISDDVWDRSTVTDSDRTLIAADDANRIIAVSRSALELLGHVAASDLVGHRLISLIPQRFHQAHIAGFTLHLVNGRSPLLGNPVAVPMLGADGLERPVDIVIEGQLLANGRRVFVAEVLSRHASA